MQAIQSVLSEEQKAQFRPTPVEFPKGYATFHHPLTIHGSYANQSTRPRRGMVINAFRDGVQSAADKPVLHGVPLIPRGQKMNGQFFPLLSAGPGASVSEGSLPVGNALRGVPPRVERHGVRSLQNVICETLH